MWYSLKGYPLTVSSYDYYRGVKELYLSELHIENYRLLKDVTISFDRSLTLFVGKNNTGKTSVMTLIKFLLSDEDKLSFDDYPLDCRDILYSAVKTYWNSKNDYDPSSGRKSPDNEFSAAVPILKVTFKIDYSDKNLGAVSEFIIDLDEDVTTAWIEVSFGVKSNIAPILDEMRKRYETIRTDKDKEESVLLVQVVREFFPKLFDKNVAAVNPTNPSDIYPKNKSSLKDIFNYRVIHAERSLDESSDVSSNPISSIMRRLFETELSNVESGLQAPMEELHKIVESVNFNLQSEINNHMDAIVRSMLSFGYPSGEELQLKANTLLELQKSIQDNTELRYVTDAGNEALPEGYNGLGYKNLIKITMVLHDYVRGVKEDVTKIPILFVEEPEAHMHPQLQTTFVSFLTKFLSEQVGTDVVQVIMTTHSSHVANTVDFSKVRYIRRYESSVVCKKVVDFVNKSKEEEKEEHLNFLQKYMKLSYCDLYFCDKAILVEGASERLLLPGMIKKCRDDFGTDDVTLESQYVSIIEVGGAYAHHFYDFMNYLEIPTLVITDIDFVRDKNKKCKCEEAKGSSNGAIIRWCRDMYNIAISNPVPIDKIIELSTDEEKKTNSYIHIEFQKEQNGYHPRSLEDAIINCNRTMFEKSEADEIDFEEMGREKTDFAIDLLVKPEYEEYEVPSYIHDGLVWLNSQSKVAMREHAVKKYKRKYKSNKTEGVDNA